jgi:hypothetical protein
MMSSGGAAVVLMNRGIRGSTTEVTPDELGLRHADEYHVRDLWPHTSTVRSGDVQAWVPHAARMFLASPGYNPPDVRNQWSHAAKITKSAMKLRQHRGIPTMSHALGDGQLAAGCEYRCRR